ncbi:hypothetical protein WQ56_00995 [Luteimonas sp. FCS-9]|nr:hypothetical protein WQ56_00995 [Luteimonas sp. FCS-9]
MHIGLFAAGIVLVLLVLVLRLLAPAGEADDVGTPIAPAPPVPTRASPAVASPDAGGAVIVDDTGEAVAANPLARIEDVPVASVAPHAPTATPAASAPPVPVDTNADRTSPRPARRAASTSGRQAQGTEDAALLATLMRIIGQDERAPDPASHESMDALITDILASNQQAEQDTQKALASIGGDRPAPPPSRRQAADTARADRELRACPAANTLEGLRCRDQVCSRRAGQHPACPRR